MKITQENREAAAAKLCCACAKEQRVHAAILAGEADDHPAVQAEAFFRSSQ